MSTNHRYSDYDSFAWIYSTHWGNMFLEKLIPVMEKLLLLHIPPAGWRMATLRPDATAEMLFRTEDPVGFV